MPLSTIHVLPMFNIELTSFFSEEESEFSFKHFFEFFCLTLPYTT